MGYQVNDNIVILGDLNSDLFIANNNKLIETMMLFNLVNIISKPTRITAHIIISDTMNYIYSDVLKIPSEISDHDASVTFLQCPKSAAGSFKREVWLYDTVDKQKFIEKLEIVDWRTLLCQFEDVDDILPKHFSNWQGSVFQLRQLLLDIMTDRGSPVKSGKKYVSGTEYA
jgi:hypothetical protein